MQEGRGWIGGRRKNSKHEQEERGRRERKRKKENKGGISPIGCCATSSGSLARASRSILATLQKEKGKASRKARIQ
jgi:hypothetical protein